MLDQNKRYKPLLAASVYLFKMQLWQQDLLKYELMLSYRKKEKGCKIYLAWASYAQVVYLHENAGKVFKK